MFVVTFLVNDRELVLMQKSTPENTSKLPLKLLYNLKLPLQKVDFIKFSLHQKGRIFSRPFFTRLQRRLFTLKTFGFTSSCHFLCHHLFGQLVLLIATYERKANKICHATLNLQINRTKINFHLFVVVFFLRYIPFGLVLFQNRDHRDILSRNFVNYMYGDQKFK